MMNLEIISFTLEPMDNNTYLVADPESGSAAVIDPSFGSQKVVDDAHRRSWRIEQIWLTHAHFDHIAGLIELTQRLFFPPAVSLHPADLPVWEARGGAQYFGIPFEPGPPPDQRFSHGQTLHLGSSICEVRHTPGHSPGHVVIYSDTAKALFCGDVIFNGSIGRTDLPGGSHATLLDSIRSQVLTLPDDTRLFPGHGPASSVGAEKVSNPFLVD